MKKYFALFFVTITLFLFYKKKEKEMVSEEYAPQTETKVSTSPKETSDAASKLITKTISSHIPMSESKKSKLDLSSLTKELRDEISKDPFLLKKLKIMLQNKEEYSARLERKNELMIHDPERAKQENLANLEKFYVQELNLDSEKASQLISLESNYQDQREVLTQRILRKLERDESVDKEGKLVEKIDTNYEKRLQRYVGQSNYDKIKLFRLN